MPHDNNRHTSQGESRNQKWFDMNMMAIRECRVPFTQKQTALLIREEGMPKVDFYPHTGRWRVAGQTKTYSGGARAFINWYRKTGTRDTNSRLERIRTSAGAHTSDTAGQPCNCNTCYLLKELEVLSGDLVPALVTNPELMTLRPEVQEFAIAMEKTLRSHDDSKGDSWSGMGVGQLMDKLRDEVIELDQAVDLAALGGKHRPPMVLEEDAERVQHEAVDVANFALMVYHNTTQKG